MNGLDTNILVRYLVQDDPPQFARACQIFERAEAEKSLLRINTVVLCELVWVLRGSRYRLGRDEIGAAIEMLLDTRILEIEHRDEVRVALADYQSGEGDFADYLIGRMNAAAGCGTTWTLDRSLEPNRLFAIP